MIGRSLLLRHCAALLAGLAWPLTARDAQARDNETPDAESREVDHRTSITFAPEELLAPPMLRVIVERALPSQFGVAGIFGVGWNGPADWVVGAQVRYYLLGDFNHGMPLLIQQVYRWGQSSALLWSPMIGYKLALEIGFTLDLAAGAQFTFVETGSYEIGPRIWPVIELNLGWSF